MATCAQLWKNSARTSGWTLLTATTLRLQGPNWSRNTLARRRKAPKRASRALKHPRQLSQQPPTKRRRFAAHVLRAITSLRTVASRAAATPRLPSSEQYSLQLKAFRLFSQANEPPALNNVCNSQAAAWFLPTFHWENSLLARHTSQFMQMQERLLIILDRLL